MCSVCLSVVVLLFMGPLFLNLSFFSEFLQSLVCHCMHVIWPSLRSSFVIFLYTVIASLSCFFFFFLNPVGILGYNFCHIHFVATCFPAASSLREFYCSFPHFKIVFCVVTLPIFFLFFNGMSLIFLAGDYSGGRGTCQFLCSRAPFSLLCCAALTGLFLSSSASQHLAWYRRASCSIPDVIPITSSAPRCTDTSFQGVPLVFEKGRQPTAS